MSETQINQNQIVGVKILNVVQTGTLTRDGAIFSGFSGDDYLTFGARVDKGILSLDSSTYVKDFGAMTETANTWEMVWKFSHKSNNAGVIFACNVSEGNQLVAGDNLELDLSNESGNWSIGEVTGTTTLTIDTIYWVKVEFTGTAYIMSLSTDGTNFTTEATIISSTKLTNRAVYLIGKNSGGYPLGEDLDLSGCYVKADGEYWWKGVETI